MVEFNTEGSVVSPLLEVILIFGNDQLVLDEGWGEDVQGGQHVAVTEGSLLDVSDIDVTLEESSTWKIKA